jgi:hypothetical protein
MISIRQAAKQGIAKLRRPEWADPADHIHITIVDGLVGPWVELWSPINQEVNGCNPVKLLITEVGPDAEVFVPFWHATS